MPIHPSEPPLGRAGVSSCRVRTRAVVPARQSVVNPSFAGVAGAAHATETPDRRGQLTVQALSADRVAFVSSGTEEADAALHRLRSRYGDTGIDDAEVVVALGGDGLMLQTLHHV